MNENSLSVLESCAEGVSDLVKRQITKNCGNPLPGHYSHTLKSFSMTLNFYSSSAYKYIRCTFETCLPHPQTLRKWYKPVDATPGFTEASFSALRQQTEFSLGPNNVFSLILDEMAVRQNVQWDGKKFHGFTDMGTELDNDPKKCFRGSLPYICF